MLPLSGSISKPSSLQGFKMAERFANWALPKKSLSILIQWIWIPQEEELALMSLQPRSFYKIFYFPKDFNDIYEGIGVMNDYQIRP